METSPERCCEEPSNVAEQLSDQRPTLRQAPALSRCAHHSFVLLVMLTIQTSAKLAMENSQFDASERASSPETSAP
jgi:hypothetical protein